MRAVDALPCAAARREVAKVCAGEQPDDDDEEGNRDTDGDGSKLEGEPAASDGSSSFSRGGASEGGGSGDARHGRPWEGKGKRRVAAGLGSGGDGRREGRGCWWDKVRARLVRGGGFTECAAADVLARLEWAAGQADDDADDDDEVGEGLLEDEAGAAASAGGWGEGGGGGGRGGGAGRGAGGEEGRGASGGKRRRMLRHLDATRVLCREWRLVREGGVASSSRRDASASATGSGGGGGGRGSGGGHGGRGGGSWSGWEAFALAVATSASRDRLSLCCWAVRPLMGGDSASAPSTYSGGVGGKEEEGQRQRRPRAPPPPPSCLGLPRGEVIELLCLMLCALRSLGGGGGRRSGSEGSVRLKADLLVCARVLENWDIRWTEAGREGGVLLNDYFC